MCEEGGSPVRKFCPTHLPLASHNLEELLFPASLSTVPGLGGYSSLLEPSAVGVGRHQAMSRPHSLSAVGRD